jgi:hypothetical protein
MLIRQASASAPRSERDAVRFAEPAFRQASAAVRSNSAAFTAPPTRRSNWRLLSASSEISEAFQRPADDWLTACDLSAGTRAAVKPWRGLPMSSGCRKRRAADTF